MSNDINRQTLLERAQDLRINPSERVWDRLEKRLDQDQDKIKIGTFRKWMAIAAGIVLAISMFFLITIERTLKPQFVLEDLESLPGASFASYQYASELNEIYERGTWVNFSEGNRKRFKSNSNEELIIPERDQDSLKGGNL